MAEKRFHRQNYPWKILGEFGLTEEMISDLPDFVHDTLEAGCKSPLLPIAIKQPFGFTHCYAKFRLIETEHGTDVMFSPKLKETDLSSFSDSEKQSLLDGKVIVTNIEETYSVDDETQKLQIVRVFVQLDKDTNGIVYVPTQIIGKNLQTLSNDFDLSDEDLQSLLAGELITVSTSDSEDQTGNVTIGIDLFSERGVAMASGDKRRWEQIARKPMPEYSFGNDGCWINHGGKLSYLPENEFTDEIFDAMKRNARKNGIPMEEINEHVEIHNQEHIAEKEDEARQLAR